MEEGVNGEQRIRKRNRRWRREMGQERGRRRRREEQEKEEARTQKKSAATQLIHHIF